MGASSGESHVAQGEIPAAREKTKSSMGPSKQGEAAGRAGEEGKARQVHI